MTYEDMNLAQLKALCKDRKLGTGRSKQELTSKLEADDKRVRELAKNTIEDQLDKPIEKAEPVDSEAAETPEPTPEPELPHESSSPTIFRISFSHNGPLLDSDHNSFREKTRALAVAEGYTPFGGTYAALLRKSENGQLTYELEVY